MDASFNSQIVCRICYSNEDKEDLANWCNCSGKIGLMHKSCLERWISRSFWCKCEICNYQYDFKFEIMKPTFKQVTEIYFVAFSDTLFTHCYFKQWLFRTDVLSDANWMYLVSLYLLPINALLLFFSGCTFTYIAFSLQIFSVSVSFILVLFLIIHFKICYIDQIN